MNLALGKPTAQSSTMDIYDSQKAVDGSVSGVFTDGSCAHTFGGEQDPWFRVDLEKQETIKQVFKPMYSC